MHQLLEGFHQLFLQFLERALPMTDQEVTVPGFSVLEEKGAG